MVKIIYFTRLLLLGIIIPVIMSTMVYQGFSTNFTGKVFSKAGFEHQYENKIYKYRVLGRIALLKTYDLIKRYDIPTIAPKSLNLLDPDGDPQFYSAYYYMNTIFLCLTSLVLFFILGGNHSMDFITIDLPLLLTCFLIAITQYVVVPYDVLSYFLLTAAVFLINQRGQILGSRLTLCLVVILATLTRETATLILAYYFAVNYKAILSRQATFKLNWKQKELLILVFCFLCFYLGTRLFFGFDEALYNTARRFNSFSIMGILFFLSMSFLVLVTKFTSKEIFVLLMVSLPYTLPIFFVANPWEIRLWTPVIMLLIIMKVQAAQQDLNRLDPSIQTAK
jgi:hypothetical protein